MGRGRGLNTRADLPLPVIASASAHGLDDGLVGRIKVEALWIELLTRPAAHRLVLFMLGVEPCLQEVRIARVSADIFWRTCPIADDATRILDLILDLGAAQHQPVLPVIAKVVLVGDGDGEACCRLPGRTAPDLASVGAD